MWSRSTSTVINHVSSMCFWNDMVKMALYSYNLLKTHVNKPSLIKRLDKSQQRCILQNKKAVLFKTASHQKCIIKNQWLGSEKADVKKADQTDFKNVKIWRTTSMYTSYLKRASVLGMVEHTYNPSTGRQKQEDCKFKASLDYIC
jgi:hypothetical protein